MHGSNYVLAIRNSPCLQLTCAFALNADGSKKAPELPVRRGMLPVPPVEMDPALPITHPIGGGANSHSLHIIHTSGAARLSAGGAGASCSIPLAPSAHRGLP